ITSLVGSILKKRQALERSEEIFHFRQMRQSITPRLSGKIIPGFHNYWVSWQTTSITDRLRMRSKNISRLKRQKILMKPLQEGERILYPTCFLAADSFSPTKATCIRQET